MSQKQQRTRENVLHQFSLTTHKDYIDCYTNHLTERGKEAHLLGMVEQEANGTPLCPPTSSQGVFSRWISWLWVPGHGPLLIELVWSLSISVPPQPGQQQFSNFWFQDLFAYLKITEKPQGDFVYAGYI